VKQDKRAVRSARFPIMVIAISGALLAASPASATTLDPQGPYTGTVGTPLGVSVVLGGLVSSLPSTLTLNVYGSQDPTCTAPPIASTTRPANDNGTYAFDPFTLSAAGTYRFIANYPGDGGNSPASTSCADPRAAIVISPPSSDTTSPDTRITAHPKKKLKIGPSKKKAKASFGFTSTEAGSSFECRIDAKAFAPCTSPKKYKLKKGKHTFAVAATDAAGNRDATPAEFKVKVVRKR
jgi:hypothetical protein